VSKQAQFLNVKAVKQFALDYAKHNRFHTFDQVGADFVTHIDGVVRSAIISLVTNLPSKGKTLQ
jgi:hypothetical protein